MSAKWAKARKFIYDWGKTTTPQSWSQLWGVGGDQDWFEQCSGLGLLLAAFFCLAALGLAVGDDVRNRDHSQVMQLSKGTDAWQAGHLAVWGAQLA